MRYSEIRTGNVEVLAQKLKDGEISLISDAHILSEDKERNAMYHFVIASYALADACVEGGMRHDETYKLSDVYIRKADDCKTYIDIDRLYGEMCLDFAERMHGIQKKDDAVSLHVRKCIDYIYKNLGADLSLKALAKLLDLHPSYFSRLFSNETGMSITQFVMEARVDAAQNLLRCSEMSCQEISETLGFCSHSAFISTFRRITGVTPRVYRERHYSIQEQLKPKS